MGCSQRGALKWVRVVLVQRLHAQAQVRATQRAGVRLARLVLIVSPLFSALLSPPSFSQDTRSVQGEFLGHGVEITVRVLDSSGEALSVPAVVRLYREGVVPTGQSETSRGQAIFIVNSLGDFTVVVSAAGYADAQKEVSVNVTGHVHVDIYLRSAPASGNSRLPPGRPLLAPKAKDAFDKARQALIADKLDEAEKFVRRAVQLAPAHPDVLYLQGLLLMKQQNWPQAQLSFEKAAQIDATNAPALAALGMALYDQGQYDAAIAPLEKSLQLEQPQQSPKPPQPKNSPAQKPLVPENASQPGQPPQSNSGSAWQTRWLLAQAYYHQGQYDQALQLSQQALGDSHGKAPEIALVVAQSLTAVGSYDAAAQTLRDFLRDHPRHPQAPTAQRWLARLVSSGNLRSN